MAYVPVPKDLSKVKNKIIFNLTGRQCICFVLAGLVGIPFYIFTKKVIGVDVAATIMVILMLPFFFFALYEKDGLTPEKLIRNYIKTKYLNKATRLYKTENDFKKDINVMAREEVKQVAATSSKNDSGTKKNHSK